MTACGSSGGNELVGRWERLTYEGKPRGKFVTISREGSTYYYEDEDSKYKATFKDGQLHISVGLGEAVAYYDKESDTMRLSYGGSQLQFRRVK